MSGGLQFPCPVSQFMTKKQDGIGLLMFTLLIATVSFSFLFSYITSNSVQNERDKKTALALAEAKAALIGFAASVNLPNTSCIAANNNCARPGDLPCPDTDDDGDAESSCGNTAGTTGQDSRIGRLPWRTLGLPDLRDGNGDRLWYALSNNFKNNFRTSCTAPGSAGCLNSDTAGSISVRGSDGTVINNASTGSGVVAIVFSPGVPITRQDGVEQDRGCTGCTTDAINYLDVVGGVDDNAGFIDSSAADGFIAGPVLDNVGQTLVNDRLLTIATAELMPVLEKRVANEVLACMKNYASSNPGGVGRHPWTTNGAGVYPSFTDSTERRIGRVPDTLFINTVASSAANMSSSWPATCKIYSSSGWWLNWKELVFYAVAWDRDPASTFPVPDCGDEPGVRDCLSVITPTGTQSNRNVVVIVAGKTLTAIGQGRSTNAQKQSLTNYLEGDNSSSTAATRNPNNEDAVFEKGSMSTTFNDVVVSY